MSISNLLTSNLKSFQNLNINNLSVGVNGSQNTSSTVEIAGNKALLLPRMTTLQRNSLIGINGMEIYNTTTNRFEFCQGFNQWVEYDVLGTGTTGTTGATGATGNTGATGPGPFDPNGDINIFTNNAYGNINIVNTYPATGGNIHMTTTGGNAGAGNIIFDTDFGNFSRCGSIFLTGDTGGGGGSIFLDNYGIGGNLNLANLSSSGAGGNVFLTSSSPNGGASFSAITTGTVGAGNMNLTATSNSMTSSSINLVSVGVTGSGGNASINIFADDSTSGVYVVNNLGINDGTSLFQLQQHSAGYTGSVGGTIDLYTPFNGKAFAMDVLIFNGWNDIGQTIPFNHNYVQTPVTTKSFVIASTTNTNNIVLPATGGAIDGTIVLMGAKA